MATKKRAARKLPKTSAIARSKGQPRRVRAPRSVYLLVTKDGTIAQTATKLGLAKSIAVTGETSVVGPYVLAERIRQE